VAEAAPGGAYAGFEGHVGSIYATSEPWWPPRPEVSGKPNVVIVMVDDLGYSDLGCFGSEIATPNLDRLAADGVQLTNFHVAPMCSPTRAALLTGCNPHSVGFGTVANFDPGFPGFTMEFPDDVATIAESFRDAGYATFAVGKWHLCKETDMHDAGSKASWPCQRGFDRYYGFLDGFTNFHQPHRLYEDNHAVDTDSYPDGYYLTDDLTERSIELIRASRASDPTKPFLLYLAHGAVHAPLQAKDADIAAQHGRYAAGWDAVRQRRHARQLELGVLEPGTELAPRNHEPDHDVGAWDDLTDAEQRLHARYMEVYAAMVTSVDESIGRLRRELEAQGVWDDTIVVFTSDNGASKEGGAQGTTRYLDVLRMGPVDGDVAHDLGRLDLIGGPRVLAHYPRGWAMASNTPFRLYKINTHAGGCRVPFVMSWPSGLGAGERRRQYAFVSDLYPTLAEMAGVPMARTRHGSPVRAVDGLSFAPVLHDGDAPPVRRSQHYEMTGHRGYYRDGLEIVSVHARPSSFGDHEWELYDLEADPTEIRDLAAQRPHVVAELAAAWRADALANAVLPLDEGVGLRGVFRPPHPELEAPVTLAPGASLERARSNALIANRAFVIRVSLRFAGGDRGVLVAHGDQGGGYVMYVDEDRLWWAHSDFGDVAVFDVAPLVGGTHELVVSVEVPEPDRWSLSIAVDGGELAPFAEVRAPSGLSPLEGIDVGADRRSPVHWELGRREGSFRYSGQLDSVRYEPGPLLVDRATRIARLRELGRRYE